MEQDRLLTELGSARTHAEELAAHTAELEAALDAHRALLHVLQSVTNRRTSRRRTLSQLGSWLFPPTPRKLSYLRRYLALRRSGEFDVDSYLLANPDVLAAGINPLMHYVQYGRQEGRSLDGYVEQPNATSPLKSSPSDAVDPAERQLHRPQWKSGRPPPRNEMTKRSSGLRASSTNAFIWIRTRT